MGVECEAGQVSQAMIDMRTITTHNTRAGESVILCDPSLPAQVDDSWFAPARGPGNATVVGGRGSAWVVATPMGEAVLRHYRRGGLVARLLRDRYLWTNLEASRPYEELQLLLWMHAQKLPVPTPIAARVQRSGMFYRGDLLTLRLADTRTMAQLLADSTLDAEFMGRIGATIADFHRLGVCHADLNAHNILVGDRVYLIDFDRGRRREPAADWQRANLDRLQRSLRKLSAGTKGVDAVAWAALERGYATRQARTPPPLGSAQPEARL
ncbi:3-deoxy-D-manno-octulosonic acid kinase [Tahibacter amnicola]|uniref:3-deoxy-D-manno-octulosonic acid kinase n=1 Tax=Tahibacter amnicola TaxID=2976241 RepID=A0ABY6BPD2_9GAMM|nr:3-deoxy-D-manno-octulosonic acid kinase [Tahibacter amnicola]UXI69627.1 3-deoxy-D-manno-octulosonic acid kinase [Tahibacter amnicola]